MGWAQRRQTMRQASEQERLMDWWPDQPVSLRNPSFRTLSEAIVEGLATVNDNREKSPNWLVEKHKVSVVFADFLNTFVTLLVSVRL